MAWRLAYYTENATGVSIQLEGTDDIGGAPNSSGWTALTAVPNTTSPAIGTTNGQADYCCDYYPWVRVNPTTLTGTAGFALTARSYGYKGTSAALGSGGGGGGNAAIFSNTVTLQQADILALDTVPFTLVPNCGGTCTVCAAWL